MVEVGWNWNDWEEIRAARKCERGDGEEQRVLRWSSKGSGQVMDKCECAPIS
jgi:hypothetical protein